MIVTLAFNPLDKLPKRYDYNFMRSSQFLHLIFLHFSKRKRNIKNNWKKKNKIINTKLWQFTAGMLAPHCFIQKQNGIQWNTGLLFENMYFYCTYSIKTKILSMLVLGAFWKSQNSVPAKHKKSLICKNKLPQKFRASR